MDIIQYISKHSSDIVVILSFFGIFLEVTPIKINPVSSLLGWIGKNVNKEIIERISKLEIKVDENEKDRIRHEIYTFANNIRNRKRKYTVEEFKHIFEINEKYKKMGGNGQIKVEMKFIQEKYMEIGGEKDE